MTEKRDAATPSSSSQESALVKWRKKFGARYLEKLPPPKPPPEPGDPMFIGPMPPSFLTLMRQEARRRQVAKSKARLRAIERDPRAYPPALIDDLRQIRVVGWRSSHRKD